MSDCQLSIVRLADKDRGKCFGGVARLATAVNIDDEDHVEDDDDDDDKDDDNDDVKCAGEEGEREWEEYPLAQCRRFLPRHLQFIPIAITYRHYCSHRIYFLIVFQP